MKRSRHDEAADGAKQRRSELESRAHSFIASPGFLSEPSCPGASRRHTKLPTIGPARDVHGTHVSKRGTLFPHDWRPSLSRRSTPLPTHVLAPQEPIGLQLIVRCTPNSQIRRVVTPAAGVRRGVIDLQPLRLGVPTFLANVGAPKPVAKKHFVTSGFGDVTARGSFDRSC